jgi:hypothetical protein
VITLPSTTGRRQGVDLRAVATIFAAASAGVGYLLWSLSSTGDYLGNGPVAGDNAGPAITALAHGHLGALAANQPLMGLTSILLRAPLVALSDLFGGSALLGYRLGAFVCMIPAIALGAWMISRRGISRQARLAGGLAALVVLGGPATIQAINLGHPEEVLAAVLMTGAVLAATRGRSGWAGVFLGLAVGTKQWALLAAPCVLFALPERRLATATKAGAIGLVLTATLPLADPAVFARADAIVGGVRYTNPLSLWWPFGSAYPVPARATVPVAHVLPLGLTRSTASAIAMLVALSVVWMHGRRTRVIGGGIDALALLALAGLARCVCDPDPLQYYFLDLLLPLAAWESVTLKRFPVVTGLATGAAALLASGRAAFLAGASLHPPALVNALTISAALALGFYLARRAFLPSETSARRFELTLDAIRPNVGNH